jgi:toxin ParE1/3/4
VPKTGRFTVSPLAAADIRAAFEYLFQRDARAAEQFLNSVSELALKLSSNPRMGRKRLELGETIRSFPVGNYILYYRYSATPLEIVRVLHAARDVTTAWAQIDD